MMSNIPAGFKQTEVGIIPNDWEVIKLCEISDIDTETLSTSTNPEYCFQYISIDDVDNGVLRNKTEMFFKNAPSRAKRKIRLNDILISTVRPNLKSHLFIQEEVKDWICSTGFAVIRCKTDISDSGYVYNYFFSSIINKQIDNLISGSNYPAINSKDVHSLLIPLPPTKAEQTAIATALNDADELISSLEKLIAKKRNIKQGAMQELLRPKEGWEVKSLGVVADFNNGKAHEQFIQENGKYLVVNSKFISTEGKIVKYSNEQICPLFKGDIAIVMSDIPNGKALAKCFLIDKDNQYTLNQRIGSIRPKNGDSNYYCYQLNRNKYFLAFDSGAGQTNLRRDEILDCPIPLPPTLKDQTNISKIITDMDAEIESLEKKLEKYKKIKQGMMQNLLTGRIRIIDNG